MFTYFVSFFFFNDTAATEIYTLSLHDALPISMIPLISRNWRRTSFTTDAAARPTASDRKSTRLNSSHRCISYAVFCLKKKKSQNTKDQVYAKNEMLAYQQKESTALVASIMTST